LRLEHGHHPSVQGFYQILSDGKLLEVDPAVFMTIIGLLIAMPVLNFNLFVIFKQILTI
jgi:hypothetical protein